MSTSGSLGFFPGHVMLQNICYASLFTFHNDVNQAFPTLLIKPLNWKVGPPPTSTRMLEAVLAQVFLVLIYPESLE